jgi:hypothetical protein
MNHRAMSIWGWRGGRMSIVTTTWLLGADVRVYFRIGSCTDATIFARPHTLAWLFFRLKMVNVLQHSRKWMRWDSCPARHTKVGFPLVLPSMAKTIRVSACMHIKDCCFSTCTAEFWELFDNLYVFEEFAPKWVWNSSNIRYHLWERGQQ